MNTETFSVVAIATVLVLQLWTCVNLLTVVDKLRCIHGCLFILLGDGSKMDGGVNEPD